MRMRTCRTIILGITPREYRVIYSTFKLVCNVLKHFSARSKAQDIRRPTEEDSRTPADLRSTVERKRRIMCAYREAAALVGDSIERPAACVCHRPAFTSGRSSAD